MSQLLHDVLGIGNAIVDVLVQVDDAVLAEHGLHKGAMALVDADAAAALLASLPPGVECSGGSAANTLAGLAELGIQTAYIGKVAPDRLGGVFARDMQTLGVDFNTQPGGRQPPTAQCVVLVTPDGQRTMQTHLGACVELGPEDVSDSLVASAGILYLEGYLWDRPAAKDAFRKAMRIAHAAGRRVALTLSDAFCVDRHRAEFAALVQHEVDILFANEAEIMSLYQVATVEEALARVPRKEGRITVVTRSEKGAIVMDHTTQVAVPAQPGVAVVDTTGAGDLFAAGFLYGLVSGFELADCARAGVVAAAEVISHVGARPQAALLPLMQDRLGL